MVGNACSTHVTKMATEPEMTSHDGVGVVKEVRTAHALLLTDFRVQVAGVECTGVWAGVSCGGHALLQDVVETAWWLSGRQLGRRQLCELRQRRTAFAATVNMTHPANQRTSNSVRIIVSIP